jgi:WXG100 family type VII secretion target
MTLIRVTPSELRAFDTRCRGDAATIEQVKQHVAQALASLDWNSPAAQRFRTGWDTDFRPALDKLGLALQELGSAANRMAENYEAAEAAFMG